MINRLQLKPSPSSLQLLRCGHLYHKQCIEQNEYHTWNNKSSGLIYPIAKCPFCRCNYNINQEKFNYDKKFWKQLPSLHRFCQSYGFYFG